MAKAIKRKWEDADLLMALQDWTPDLGDPIPSEKDLRRLLREIAEGAADPDELASTVRTLGKKAGILNKRKGPGRPEDSKGKKRLGEEFALASRLSSLFWAMWVLDAATAAARSRADVDAEEHVPPTLGDRALRRLTKRLPSVESHEGLDVLMEMLRAVSHLPEAILRQRALPVWNEYATLAKHTVIERFAKKGTVPAEYRRRFGVRRSSLK